MHSQNGHTNEPESPCVRNCCLDADDICLGCGRSLDEIVGWQRFDGEEKRLVLARCAARRAKKV